MIPRYVKSKKSRPLSVTKVMKSYREAHVLCEACRGHSPEHTHHIVTRGAGGIDEPGNFLALCAACHAGAHAMGWQRFAQAWPHIQPKIITARIAQGKKLT